MRVRTVEEKAGNVCQCDIHPWERIPISISIFANGSLLPADDAREVNDRDEILKKKRSTNNNTFEPIYSISRLLPSYIADADDMIRDKR